MPKAALGHGKPGDGYHHWPYRFTPRPYMFTPRQGVERRKKIEKHGKWRNGGASRHQKRGARDCCVQSMPCNRGTKTMLFHQGQPFSALENVHPSHTHSHPTHIRTHTMSSVATTATSSGTATAATSQHSLRQQVRSQITEYSRLTNALFTSLDVLADGKAAPAAPNDIMKQIVQLDATLMGAVEKSMFSNQDHAITFLKKKKHDDQSAFACS